MENNIYIWIFTIVAIGLYFTIYKNSSRKIIAIYDKDSWFGFGDYIKAQQFLLQNENSCDIHVNYKEHPIGKYLINNNGNNIELPKGKNLPIYRTDETNYHRFKNIDKTIMLYCNATPLLPISKNILKKVKNMFVPTEELQKDIDFAMNKIGIKKKQFIVVHIRLMDSNNRKSSMYMSDKLQELLKSLQKLNNINVPILVMSNSMITKTSIASHYKFLSMDIVPTHTGGQSLDKSNISDDIKGTLIEFFTMSHAKKIYQFNEQKGFESGFSQRVSELFEVPIIRI